jgi:hypothetical protein
MPRKVKAVSGDLLGTAASDSFILHASDGPQLHTISGFDPAHDKLILDFDHTYSDIMELSDIYDGAVLHDFGGGRAEFHALNGGTEIDAYGVSGELHIFLAGLNPDSLHAWNIAGG